jgi:hypothetical protein
MESETDKLLNRLKISSIASEKLGTVSLHKRVGRFDSLLRTEEARRECLFKFYEKMTTAKK